MNEGPTSSEELEEFARENFFSSEEFLENRESIIATVALLLKNPKSRRRFEKASIYTVQGGELLARVLHTPHGLVVVNDGRFPEGMWETHVAPNIRSGFLVDVPPDVQHPEFIRMTDPIRLIMPMHGSPSQRFILTSRSRTDPYRIVAEDILRHLGKMPYSGGYEFLYEDGLTFG